MRALQNAGLLLLSALVGFFLVELGLRFRAVRQDQRILSEAMRDVPPVKRGREVRLRQIIRLSADDRIVYELQPGIRARLFDRKLSTSSAGFRDREYALEKDPEVTRIVGLGDSFMFGWKLDDGEDYLSRLERILNRKRPDRQWEVINTAVPGYNTVMQVATLEEKGLAYQPDLVILGLVGNDLDLPNFIRAKRNHWSLRESFLVEEVARLLNPSGETEAEEEFDWAPLPTRQDVEPLLLGPPRAQAGRGAGHRYEHDLDRIPPQYHSLVGWDAFEGAMKRLSRLGERHGFSVIVAYLAPNQPPEMEEALALSAKLEFLIVDMGPHISLYMEEQGIERFQGSVLTVSESNAHPSALANRLAARVIFDEIESLFPAGSR